MKMIFFNHIILLLIKDIQGKYLNYFQDLIKLFKNVRLMIENYS